jgi:hypothetical protein
MDAVIRVALVLAILFAPTVASADAIPLLTCASGWQSRNAGHSAYCAPTTCTSDAECGGGTCVEVARCMRTQRMDVGDAPPQDPWPTYEEPTTTLCAADGSCSAAETHCAHARECTAPPPASSSGCAVGHASVGGFALALVMLALVSRAWRGARRGG